MALTIAAGHVLVAELPGLLVYAGPATVAAAIAAALGWRRYRRRAPSASDVKGDDADHANRS